MEKVPTYMKTPSLKVLEGVKVYRVVGKVHENTSFDNLNLQATCIGLLCGVHFMCVSQRGRLANAVAIASLHAEFKLAAPLRPALEHTGGDIPHKVQNESMYQQQYRFSHQERLDTGNEPSQ